MPVPTAQTPLPFFVLAEHLRPLPPCCLETGWEHLNSGDTGGQVSFKERCCGSKPRKNFSPSSHGAKLTFQTVLTGSNAPSDRLVFTGDNRAVLSALLLLRAGAAAAGSAPLKLQSGPLNTAPESGALEFDGETFILHDWFDSISVGPAIVEGMRAKKKSSEREIVASILKRDRSRRERILRAEKAITAICAKERVKGAPLTALNLQEGDWSLRFNWFLLD